MTAAAILRCTAAPRGSISIELDDATGDGPGADPPAAEAGEAKEAAPEDAAGGSSSALAAREAHHHT